MINGNEDNKLIFFPLWSKFISCIFCVSDLFLLFSLKYFSELFMYVKNWNWILLRDGNILDLSLNLVFSVVQMPCNLYVNSNVNPTQNVIIMVEYVYPHRDKNHKIASNVGLIHFNQLIIELWQLLLRFQTKEEKKKIVLPQSYDDENHWTWKKNERGGMEKPKKIIMFCSFSFLLFFSQLPGLACSYKHENAAVLGGTINHDWLKTASILSLLKCWQNFI